MGDTSATGETPNRLSPQGGSGTAPPVQEHVVLIRCEQGHTQTIHLIGMSREKAALWCGLADGTSPAHVNSPVGTDSLIGKCGVCGAQIEARLQEPG